MQQLFIYLFNSQASSDLFKSYVFCLWILVIIYTTYYVNGVVIFLLHFF